MRSKIGKDSSENLPHSLIGKPMHIELFTFQEFHADCPFRSQHRSFQPIHTMTVPSASAEEKSNQRWLHTAQREMLAGWHYKAPLNTLSEAFCNSQGISVCDPGQRLVLECNAFRVHSPKCRNRGPWNRSYMAGVNTAEIPMLSPVGWSQKKHSVPGSAGTGVRSWSKSITLHGRIYLEIWTEIQRAQCFYQKP